MFRTVLASLALLSTACACAPAPSEAPADGAAAVVLPKKATGFITANPLPLGTDWKTDVRRDDYGRPFEYALLGQPLPHLTGTMVDGTSFDSADLHRWTVIDVWGIWCGDCMADAPYVAALSRAIDQDPDLDFLSIHVPASAARISPEEMFGKYGSLQAYFAEKGYSYPTVVDTDTSLREALKIAWTPSYLLVSPEGIVKGYRSEFSAAEGEPVKDFLKDVALVKAESKKSALDGLSMGPGGVSGLEAGMPFTLDAIQAALPGYEVISTRVEQLGETYPAFEVRRDGNLLLTLTPDWTLGRLEHVATESPLVAGPQGGKIGTSRLSDFAGLVPEDCSGSQSAALGMLVCPSPADARFLLIFSASGPGGTPNLLTGMAYAFPNASAGE
ncbi:MAG TPA: TlpA disulfide reductase family protein [Hyphomonas sp.]|nr:TlpA family protein disulfide reductase [Hyphomonas sp.]HPE47697.1 TlpA disulfide reductase family protein [Hyphomonas sp.]